MMIIKIVKVKTTVFTRITNAKELRDYMANCINEGKGSELYAAPAISTETYEDGDDAYTDLNDAIMLYADSPKKANLDNIADKMVLGIIWLNGYAVKVEVIANSDAHRTTREEAATNIAYSFLTPQKISRASKGNPVKPIINAVSTDKVSVDIEVVNFKLFKPSTANFIAVERPPVTNPVTPDPMVSIVNGVLKAKLFSPGDVFAQSINGKGKLVTFTGLNPLSQYDYYCYGTHGKKQIGELSTKITL